MTVKKALIRRLQQEDLDLSPDLLNEIVSEALATNARRGGKARAKALTPRRRRQIAKKAAAARWGGR